MTKFRCRCGAEFRDRRQLTEHVGLLNPHWPRSSADDQHGAVQQPVKANDSASQRI